MVIIKKIILKHLSGANKVTTRHYVSSQNNAKNANNTNSFQKKLRTDITEIINSKNICAFADKTNDIYKKPTPEHNKFLKEDFTKTYKKRSGKNFKNQSTWKQNP